MGRAPRSCCSEEKEGLSRAVKKGAWTAEEDEKLVSFIKKNKGHGSWRTLPKLAGLERCGKSCRLRWTNYLRPNIKRGSFSAEEEHTILHLHALVGNKWSSIASHLPGRTDNEVKNHWNTHLKKRLTKMGIDPVTHLPLNFFIPHHHNYGNLSTSNQFSTNEWQNALLQQSLQLNPSIACHLVQWELARLEAEARQQSVSPHDTYIQSYYAAWQERLQQNQTLAFTLSNCIINAENLQSQAITSATPSDSSNVHLSEPQNHNSQPYPNNLFKNFYPSLCEEVITSPNLVNYNTFNKNSITLNNEEIHTSTTNSISTLDTCSTSDTLSSHLISSQFVLPGEFGLDLSSNDSYNQISNIDPHESSPSLNEHTSHHHDSYWNRILNLVDHATFDQF